MKKNRLKSMMSMSYIAMLAVLSIAVAYLLSFFLQGLLPDIMRMLSVFCFAIALLIAFISAGKRMGTFASLISFLTVNATSVKLACGKTFLTFILFMIAYWGVNWTQFLYQPVSYDQFNQPVTFIPSLQQTWGMTIVLGLSIWVIAATLALVMGMLNITTMRQITALLRVSNKSHNIAHLFDNVVVGGLLATCMFILTLAILEAVRSLFYLFGAEQTIYPQLIAFFTGFPLYAAYVVFHLKQRLGRAAKKPYSLSAILCRQSVAIFFATLAGYIIIKLLPTDFIAPLLVPVRAIYFDVNMEVMGFLVVTMMGLTLTPLLGAYLAQLWAGLPIRQAAAILLGLPLLAWVIAQQLLGHDFTVWAPITQFSLLTPITEKNVLYHVDGAQISILCTTIILLLALSFRTRMQESWVRLTPHHIGRRLGRVRAWMARATLLFVLVTWAYIIFGLPAFYYLSTYVFWLVMLGISIMVCIGFMYGYKHKSDRPIVTTIYQ